MLQGLISRISAIFNRAKTEPDEVQGVRPAQVGVDGLIHSYEVTLPDGGKVVVEGDDPLQALAIAKAFHTGGMVIANRGPKGITIEEVPGRLDGPR